jgi:hypothetical protein
VQQLLYPHPVMDFQEQSIVFCNDSRISLTESEILKLLMADVQVTHIAISNLKKSSVNRRDHVKKRRRF